MAAEKWPDWHVAYDEPSRNDANRDRWQNALDDALSAGTMRMERGLHPSIYDLSGDCPRCGHQTSQQVEFGINADLAWQLERDEIARVNFTCACEHEHDDHGESAGCGWGGPLTITVERPAR